MSGNTPSRFLKELQSEIRGDVAFDRLTRGVYATDASNYLIFPVAIVLPLDDQDVRCAVEIAARHGVSILPRGGGTSLAGQTVGESMVLDFSKYMNALLEFDRDQGWARVQPGLVRDELNAAIASEGLHFAPDPATSNRANFGGMIGNNSSGTKSILYGKTVDHVIETRILLSDGTDLAFSEIPPRRYEDLAAGSDREAEILRQFRKIVSENRDEIARRFPKVMRRVGGYNLDEFTGSQDWNLSKLICGSEGTLATLLEAKVNLEPLPAAKLTCVVHFEELLEAIHAVRFIVEHGPSAVEILDGTVLDMARRNLDTAPLCGFLEGFPRAVLIVEFYGESGPSLLARAGEMIGDLRRRNLGYAYPIQESAGAQSRVWAVRKHGLGLMLGIKGDRKPVPFIEDACVPLEVLDEYIAKVLEVCERHGAPVAMYAHASVGVIHVRPILDLRTAPDIDRMRRIAEETLALVKSYHGSWSGEHGDGLVRSPFMKDFFGDRIYRALGQVKQLFDPAGLMNPGKIIDAPPMDRNLRYGTEYSAPGIETRYRYPEEGGFAAAVEMCSGVGACRKTLGGTMCPSYMVTRDEEHSTRGRANALRLAISGRLGDRGLDEPRLYEALDLCLGCKACKAECPSNVDLAKLKGEFLHRYRSRNGIPLRDRLVAATPALAGLLSGRIAPLVNRVQGSGWFRAALERTAGIDRRRILPDFAPAPLRSPAGNGSRRPEREVVLFLDTYMRHFEPHIGLAAIELLESCGYSVETARAGCCQRPRISLGQLDRAGKLGQRTLQKLDGHFREGRTVVVCEPSCASAMTDDLPDLIEDRRLGERARGRILMIDVFLDRERALGRLPEGLGSDLSRILLHGHCHQKALYGTRSMKALWDGIDGLEVDEVDSGCCGMAGSFGYEKEHYDLSRRIGERRLFPAIRSLESETAVVACGFSCRHQIEHFTGRKALHWVETITGPQTVAQVGFSPDRSGSEP